uniref:Uncharacterized protein n=1 Tax=Nelumbo nucifera TaxID=4432 RepID=A0A822XGE6_NELNU|nr:TPA_asm: hypothetical protein HUJ06_019542 [Nelumbo nucifera]
MFNCMGILLLLLMGQEEAKVEEKKEEKAEEKKEEKAEEKKEDKAEEKKEEKAEEKKEEKADEKKNENAEEKKEEPKPPEPVILFVDLHCVGCAKKIERSIMKFRGLRLILPLHSFTPK